MAGETKDMITEREQGLRLAQRKIRAMSHHALWLAVVGYRQDPLDQKLVDAVIAGAIARIEWAIDHPEAD